MLLLKDKENIVKGIDYWYIDGISLVNKINKSYKKSYNRYSFDETSVSPLVFSYARINNLRIAIIGTKEEYIRDSVVNIEKKHNIKVSYFRNGYFNTDNEREACFREIIAQKIDLLVCGMGTPWQEEFLISLKNTGWNGYGFTCGGYLHQTAQCENYYPWIFDKLNIRWVYRIIDEPKLFRRYLIDYPRFFILFKKLINNIA